MRLELARNPAERLQMAWQLARALGPRQLLRLSGQREVVTHTLTPVSIKQLVTPIRTVGNPSLHLWSRRNELSFGSETAAGRVLAELRFEPALVSAIYNVKFAMLPGTDLTTRDLRSARLPRQPLTHKGSHRPTQTHMRRWLE
jgi:hypothetical protein